jgi:prepilin-type N-terminal cleavage/methylation domain-containing protein
VIKLKLKQNYKDSGFSLIEVLISVAIFAGIGLVYLNSYETNSKLEAKIRQEIQLNNLRQSVLSSIQCPELRNACVAAPRSPNNFKFVQLTGAQMNGLDVATSSGGQNLFLRAICDSSNEVIRVQYARKDSYQGRFIPDPVTGQTNRWRNLFTTVTLICPPNSGNSCRHYSLDFITGLDVLNDFATMCDWNQIKDSCRCPAGLHLKGTDHYPCGDGFPSRARCNCCENP